VEKSSLALVLMKESGIPKSIPVVLNSDVIDDGLVTVVVILILIDRWLREEEDRGEIR